MPRKFVSGGFESATGRPSAKSNPLMRLLLNSLIISTKILNVLAFHSHQSDQDQSLQSFGPSIPSAFFRFDNLLTLKTPKENVLETRAWLAQFLESNFGIQYDIDYQVTDLFTTAHNNVEHIHLRQVVNGIPIENALMNLNIRENSVLSIGSSFIYTIKSNQNQSPTTSTSTSNNDISFIFLSRANTSNLSIVPVLSPVESLISFSKHINQPISSEKSIIFSSSASVINNASFAKNDIPVELKYMYSDGELILVWDLKIEMENNWFNVHVDSVTGTVVSVIDWVSHASYTVYPFGINDPLMGERSTVIDPANSIASPNGWHVEGNSGSVYSSTRGNNVIAQENLSMSAYLVCINLRWKGFMGK
jgi:extracellular elastinolytic metalloproteinase